VTADPGYRKTVDRIAATGLWLAAGLVCATFGLLVADIIRYGVGELSWEYFTGVPADAGRAGGIAPVLVSTVLILMVCLGAAVPVGLAAAVFLAECARRYGPVVRGVRHSLNLLAGMPSIVIGLFGNAFFSVVLGLGFSILAGGLTLACMVLPIFVRTAEQALRAVPDDYRMQAAALGLSLRTTLVRVLLPVAMPGIAAGLILGIGRAVAETAALVFTSGYVDRMPESLFDSGRALSVHIFDLAMNVPGGDRRAYAAALVLLGVLVVSYAVVQAVSRRIAPPREHAL